MQTPPSAAGLESSSTQEHSDPVLSLARVLHVNGQSTDETLAASERLGKSLELGARVIPRWGELQLQAGDGDERLVSIMTAVPTGVDMDRVLSAMRAIDEIGAGRLAPPAAKETIRAISHAPPAPTWLFTLAAAAGAAALSVIFGVQHLAAVVLIVASAAAGAVLRRTVANYSPTGKETPRRPSPRSSPTEIARMTSPA